jgi:hypothetical protein
MFGRKKQKRRFFPFNHLVSLFWLDWPYAYFNVLAVDRTRQTRLDAVVKNKNTP